MAKRVTLKSIEGSREDRRRDAALAKKMKTTPAKIEDTPADRKMDKGLLAKKKAREKRLAKAGY